jgi:hypothetical protein
MQPLRKVAAKRFSSPIPFPCLVVLVFHAPPGARFQTRQNGPNIALLLAEDQCLLFPLFVRISSVRKCLRDLLKSSIGEINTAAAYRRLTFWPYSIDSIRISTPSPYITSALLLVRSSRALDLAEIPGSVPPTNCARNPGWPSRAGWLRKTLHTNHRDSFFMGVSR